MTLGEDGLPKTINGHHALRGIAALTVVAFHWDLMSRLGLPKLQHAVTFWADDAVDLFFLLSGFIFAFAYRIKTNSQNKQTGINWRGFFVARFARIYPVYLVTLLFVMSLNGVSFWRTGVIFQDLSPASVIQNMFCVQAWLGDATAQSINMPSWSVSVEVFLYLAVFPFLIFVSGRNASVSLLPACLVLFSCGVAAAWCYTHGYLHNEPRPIVRGLAGFIGGFFLCGLIRSLNWDTPHAGKILLLGIALAFSIGYFQLGSDSIFLKTVFWCGLAMIVYGTYDNSGPGSKLYRLAPLVVLGDLSYSLYLWHGPMSMLFSGIAKLTPAGESLKQHIAFAPFQFASLIAVSAASFYFLEDPLRRFIGTFRQSARLVETPIEMNGRPS
jgi:peptidoglycan/LPS O-acetylase OafA/YrhL